MRPGTTGWLKEYFTRVSKIKVNCDTDHLFQINLHDLNEEKQLYSVIQPTGLMYGHPVKVLRDYGYNMKYWSQRQKMNLVLSDAFINRALLLKRNEIANRSDLQDVLHFSVRELVEFYQYTQNGQFSRFINGRKQRSDLEIAEKIIDQRLVTNSSGGYNFWSRFFYNSLLFIDVYYYGQWIRKYPGAEREDFDKQQEKMRLNLLKTIASAANADQHIRKEEKKLFETFLCSANLKKEMRDEARDFLHYGTSIDDIDWPSTQSWIEKKYFLELAILTIWADKEVHESEEMYLKELREKLGFDEDELNGSMMAIESFVLANWNHVHFLQKNHEFHLVKKDFVRHTSGILIKNKNALAKEIRESRELVELMAKMRREKLSPSERVKVKTQLMDILKTLPTFVIIALPGTFITLPLMLKLLPKSAFPSAFSEDEF